MKQSHFLESKTNYHSPPVFHKVSKELVSYASIYVFVNEIRVKAIIDTGSNISFISEEFAINSNLPIKKHLSPKSIKGLGDSGAKIIGESINLELKISGDTTYISSVDVIDSSQVPILLGMDWLVSAQIVLDLKEKKLKEFLNGKETSLLGTGKNCLPTTNLSHVAIPNKPIYLGPLEATTVTLQFPGEVKFFRRDKAAKLRARLLAPPKRGKAKFSIKNTYLPTKLYLETEGKAEEDLSLGFGSGIYSSYGIRGYTSAFDHERDYEFGPDASRLLPPFNYHPDQFPKEINESDVFKSERNRYVSKILKREERNIISKLPTVLEELEEEQQVVGIKDLFNEKEQLSNRTTTLNVTPQVGRVESFDDQVYTNFHLNNSLIGKKVVLQDNLNFPNKENVFWKWYDQKLTNSIVPSYYERIIHKLISTIRYCYNSSSSKRIFTFHLQIVSSFFFFFHLYFSSNYNFLFYNKPFEVMISSVLLC